MGLFGKKKTPAEILAEGKALYERGDYGQAVILFLKVGRKENGEGDYWAGRGYLARFDQSGRDGDLKAARRHLSLAAGAGHAGAADLLAQRFGTGGPAAPRAEAPAKPAPEMPKPAPVPKPEPSKPTPEADTPEALYQKGMGLRDLGRYSAAFPTLLLAAGKGHGKALLQCAIMYQRGEGTAKDLRQALALAEKAKAQGVEGAEGVWADIAAQYVLDPAGGGKPAAQKPTPAPKAGPPKPSPAPEPPKPTPAGQDGPQPGEEDFQRGKELRRAKDYDGVIAAWTKAAEQGHPEALKKLTGLYAGDITVLGLLKMENRAKYVDYDKAIELGTAAMERGVDTAGRIMMAYEKKGQIEKAIDFGEKAVSRGFDAEWKLMYLCIEAGRYEDAIAWGRKYDEKKGTDEAKKRIEQIRSEAFNKGVAAHKEKDFPQALSLMEKSAGLGNSVAMFNCGIMYSTGEGMAIDEAKAIMWFEKAAQQGNPKAQEILKTLSGKIFEEGIAAYKAKNFKKALLSFEQVAKQGDTVAQFNCGLMYDKGEGTAVDKAKALMWYEKAAAQGHVKAQFSCGTMYANGWGTAVDKAKALMWFEKAAEQGYADAQCRCGMAYHKGEGTMMDRDKAFMWYEKADKQGDSDAQILIAMLCVETFREGAAAYEAKDYKKALALMEKAAERDVAEAQVTCGIMYYNGRGTAADKTKAKAWLEKAAAQTGDKDIQEKAKKILRENF